MRFQTISLVFVMVSLLLLPVALNGCGSTDHSDSLDATTLAKGGVYVIAPGFENHLKPASITANVEIEKDATR